MHSLSIDLCFYTTTNDQEAERLSSADTFSPGFHSNISCWRATVSSRHYHTPHKGQLTELGAISNSWDCRRLNNGAEWLRCTKVQISNECFQRLIEHSKASAGAFQYLGHYSCLRKVSAGISSDRMFGGYGTWDWLSGRTEGSTFATVTL